MRSQFFISTSAILLLLLTLTQPGCSGAGKDIPPLHPMRGVVTLDGKPLEKASILLLPEVGPSSGALTDENGKYEMYHRSGKKGAVKGPTKVMISTRIEDATGHMTAERVPKKYNDETTLEIDVKEGDNEENFDLKTK